MLDSFLTSFRRTLAWGTGGGGVSGSGGGGGAGRTPSKESRRGAALGRGRGRDAALYGGNSGGLSDAADATVDGLGDGAPRPSGTS